jgi:hypothetical protein
MKQRIIITLLFLFCFQLFGQDKNLYGKWIIINRTALDSSKINYDSVGLLYLEAMGLDNIKYISIKRDVLMFIPIDFNGVRFCHNISLNKDRNIIIIDSTSNLLGDRERYKFRFIDKKELVLINQYGNTIKFKRK